MRQRILLLGLIASIFLFGTCKKVTPDDDGGKDGSELLTFDKSEYYPMDVVIAQLPESATAEEYNGTLDNKPFVAVRIDDVLMFAVPDLAAGEYPLSLQIGSTKITGNLKVIALPVVQNPNAVINEIKTTFAQAVTDLEQSGDPNASLLANMSNAFNTQLAQLSEQEKQKLAALWNVHPEWGDFSEDAAFHAPSNTAEIKKAIYEFKKRLLFTVASVGTFDVSLLGLPSPFAATVALAAGISAVYNFSKLIPATGNLLEQVFIAAKEEGLKLLRKFNSPQKAPAGTADDSEMYTLNNGECLFFNVQATYRSVGAQDINGSAPAEAKLIISLVNTFHKEWDKVEKCINIIREYTPFSDNLSGRPKKVSEINNPTTELSAVEEWTLQIVSGNVSAQKQSDNSYKITTTATENVEFKFKISAEGMTSEVLSGLLKVVSENPLVGVWKLNYQIREWDWDYNGDGTLEHETVIENADDPTYFSAPVYYILTAGGSICFSNTGSLEEPMSCGSSYSPFEGYGVQTAAYGYLNYYILQSETSLLLVSENLGGNLNHKLTAYCTKVN